MQSYFKKSKAQEERKNIWKANWKPPPIFWSKRMFFGKLADWN
jgi:hypothetical protein